MAQLLCLIDSYLKEFDAVVTGLQPHEHALVPDRTAFYPGGGTQPCDGGTLNGRSLARVRKSGAGILHTVEGSLPQVGEPVRGVIDWVR